MSELNENRDIMAHAMSEFLQGNHFKSIELFGRVIDRDPGHKLAWLSRGTAQLKINHPAEAIGDFDRALELDPGYARAFHLRGVAREAQGEDQAALEDFSQAIRINPQYGAAYYSRAVLYTKRGQTDDAAADIETAIKLTNAGIETFANENNVWRSNQLRVESLLESEMNRPAVTASAAHFFTNIPSLAKFISRSALPV
jgi:Tfp pilus assembly protein PilF